ncbi:PREDICTED: HEAT repeat-containing protein 5B-like [Priapulus caudatus]|uniref:HEAT repeat-containing protein 5B-like n=1 Tax=Priapulus caudatus TaxID=37621 RepID=A0ABM1EWS5_PRICU|nr:PREDICTED: HEAT repeat-containing protein 5B-like [Priapulus caudatus]
MMELAHSLTLNEQAVAQIAETKRPIFVFEWLRFLDKVLVAAQKSDINECQKKLLGQLLHQLTETPGPPMRRLIAKNLAALFGVGDTFDLFQTVNKCNDILKNKDDSPSYLPTRLTAIACIGEMHSKLGRMMGRSFEETVLLLIKSLKNSESQGRMEIMMTLQKILAGLGSAAVSCHKDVYKATRSAMTDRSMSVRAAAAKCMLELSKEAQFMYTTELDANASLCFRALDGSNYDVRCAVSCLLGELMAKSQDPKLTSGSKAKPVSIDDALGTMASGFLRGGFGFLKGTEMIKGSSTSREVRVGVTHAYVRFVEIRGGLWLERNISLLLKHLLLDLVANPRASASHVDAVYSRKCVNFVLRTVLGELLGEKAQISAAKELCHIILQQMNLLGDATTDKDSSVESLASQHVLVCALHELSSIVQHLGTSAGPLVSEPSTGIIAPVMAVLIHQSLAARLAAAWSLRSIAVALPLQLCLLIDRCVERMESLKSSPEAIGGYSCALAALIGGVSQCPLGMPHSKSKQIFGMAEDLLRIASQNSRLSLHRTQAGWLLLGALMTLGIYSGS